MHRRITIVLDSVERRSRSVGGRQKERERDPFYCNDVVINFPPFSFTAPADGLTDARAQTEGRRDNLNGLIRREREINRWMQFRQRARHLRQQWGEDGRVGRGGSDRREREEAPSFPLAIAIANFSFPHPRCEEDEEGRRNVTYFLPMSASKYRSPYVDSTTS